MHGKNNNNKIINNVYSCYFNHYGSARIFASIELSSIPKSILSFFAFCVIVYDGTFGYSAYRIFILNWSGGHTVICGSILASSLNHSTRLTFDSQGNLWVVDSGNSRILRVTMPLLQQEKLSCDRTDRLYVGW